MGSPTEQAAARRVGAAAAFDGGRGNGSDGSSAQLLTPGADHGPGTAPALDSDPGSSGSRDHGGD